MRDFKVLRILLAIIMTIIGLILFLGGVLGIMVVISGGTIDVPIGSGSNLKTLQLGGMVGFCNAIFYLAMGIWLLRAVFKSHFGTKVVEVEEKVAVETVEFPYCRWWQNEQGQWHREENPLFVDDYPENGLCPQCGKPIEIITNSIYAENKIIRGN